ncbi:MAG TPA: hypothetical protein VHN98_01495 [Acidimicrobiales bacterium]|nr:hypothetical protein [Acidimicrobiales bacterium]
MLGILAGEVETVRAIDVIEVEEALRRQVRALDPAVLAPADAARLEDRFVAVRKLADAALAVLAARASEAGEWRSRGRHSPASDLSLRAGISVSAARDLLETSGRLAGLDATSEAVRQGRLSAEQAAAVAEAAAADPRSERDMLARAGSASLAGLRAERDRVVSAAATPDDEAARHRRLHETRALRFGRGLDGAGTGSWRVTPEVQAELKALLAPFLQHQFDAARRDGRREPSDAYAADALLEMARTAFARGGDAAAPPDVPGAPAPAARAAVAPRAPAKVIVRVDHSALLRGHTLAGETCEIAGVGPVPVEIVARLIASGDVFVAAVVTRGIDVSAVAHLGRRPNAAQLTALQWRDPTCREETCPRPVREWDHHVDWAASGHTFLPELGGLCAHHHDLKTYGGWRITTSRLPGKVRLLPPDTHDPPAR